MRFLFIVIFLPLVAGELHINFYFTDPFSNNNTTRHHCLRVVAAVDQWNINRQIISYCITSSLSSYPLQQENSFPKFTFAQLYHQNITSEQLYHWSASINLIEDYQFYLYQISTSNNSLLGNTIFYNCTLPRFGSSCEYEFNYLHSNHLSLYHMIHDFYEDLVYDPTNFTCYTRMECPRGPYQSCLDWSEICDGKIDCPHGAIDEEHCWQLEINECNKDEYRCLNGQCIPRAFYLDDPTTPDCLDQSDEPRVRFYLDEKCSGEEPSLACADIICTDMPLTSSCLPQRTNLLVKSLFSVKDEKISDGCWSALKCALGVPISMDPACENLCENRSFASILHQTCPDTVFIPAVPVLYNRIYYAYQKLDVEVLNCGNYWRPFECFNNTRYKYILDNGVDMIFDNLTCFIAQSSYLPSEDIPAWIYAYAIPTHLLFSKYTLISDYSSQICNRSSMYQCFNSSKCISIYRLMNNMDDCPHGDDEDISKNNDSNAIEQMKRNSFHCQTKNNYIPLTCVQDGKCDCPSRDRSLWCEDEDLQINYVKRNISFQTVCDGFTELLPIAIDGRNETDESECEQWLCDNVYTRCDGLWNCRKGEDEIGCYQPSLSLSCTLDEHLCISNQTHQLTCLSINKINDGHIDCVGATDERNLCYTRKEFSQTNYFYCMGNQSMECLSEYSLCNTIKNCVNGDDERFCQDRSSYSGSSDNSRMIDAEKFLRNYVKDRRKEQILYFTLDRTNTTLKDQPIQFTEIPFLSQRRMYLSSIQSSYCHLGLRLRTWFDHHQNVTNTTCLCPPSYYGDRCQYQNERVSLSLQFRVSSHSRQTPFAILISLIDDSDERIIHSHEQFTYLSTRDCKVKFSIYLVYSSRSKDLNGNYSIQIDIYEKTTLNYRGNLFRPIQFPFLPVHRLAFIVDVPEIDDHIQSCSIGQCHHGKCLRYSRNPNNSTFCQCDRGWSGGSCNIPHSCRCSPDAVCVGVDVNNRSICICPLHRFGPRCFLHHTACLKNNTCQNGGQCIPTDEFSPLDDHFTCICPRGYIGQRCETVENGLLLSFASEIISTSSVFIHFIRLIKNDQPQRATTLQTIPFGQKSLLVHWSQPFHLVFIEFAVHNYYFTLLQTTYNRSTITQRTINSTHRCRHIKELFNQSIVRLHLLRRIKHYQVPCQRDAPDLMCFYDDIHMCLCRDHRRYRVANCFEFNHNMTFNCMGQSVCQNDAQCFQDSPDCAQRSMCVCPACYYGTRCQFTTTIFTLSLDAILGYHIQPHLQISQQPSIVQVSVGLAMVFILIGLVNGILALMTFKSKVTRHVGCGYYLLTTSVTTLLITVMLGLKFWILILAQMQVITNRSFLSLQCYSIDFLLQCSLNMNQWLHACVAIERVVNMIKGARFDREKSKQVAKGIIIVLLIVIIATGIDDPIHRRLIDEENDDESRIWCVVSYSSLMQTYNSIMNVFHFVAPLLLNLISAILLITRKSRQQATLASDRNYNRIFGEELRQHKNLLIAPVISVIIGLPHLIFSFASKCMKSNSSSWLFLSGYFISFIPSMLPLALFVLPSEMHRKELRAIFARYRRNIIQPINRT